MWVLAKKTSVGCIMHIKVICKVPRIWGSNLIFGQDRKWNARGDWCKTNKITWVKLEWPPKSMFIIVWSYILCFHMHCSNKTRVDSGERNKANESHNFFSIQRKEWWELFCTNYLEGRAICMLFLKKIIRRKEQQEFTYSFSCFQLQFWN
jgi:hypothetical protein